MGRPDRTPKPTSGSVSPSLTLQTPPEYTITTASLAPRRASVQGPSTGRGPPAAASAAASVIFRVRPGRVMISCGGASIVIISMNARNTSASHVMAASRSRSGAPARSGTSWLGERPWIIIHWCQRSEGAFDTEKALDDHIEARQPCEYKASEPIDGVTRKMSEQLQRRRKDHPGQTEAESWIKVYEIPFPGE